MLFFWIAVLSSMTILFRTSRPIDPGCFAKCPRCLCTRRSVPVGLLVMDGIPRGTHDVSKATYCVAQHTCRLLRRVSLMSGFIPSMCRAWRTSMLLMDIGLTKVVDTGVDLGMCRPACNIRREAPRALIWLVHGDGPAHVHLDGLDVFGCPSPVSTLGAPGVACVGSSGGGCARRMPLHGLPMFTQSQSEARCA